jgi:hypothetical protein
MVNRAKAKGTEAETAIVEFLKVNGFPFAERRTTNGANDRGDINISPDVVIEVKNCKTMDLAGWVDEAITESENANAWLTCVWHKRIRKGHPGDWYVTMDGAVFVEILERLKENGTIR